MSGTPDRFDRVTQVAGLTLVIAGCAIAFKPSLLAGRFGHEAAAAHQLAPFLGGSLMALGLALSGFVRGRALSFSAQAALGATAYLVLTLSLWHWHIDDAAITYAYSENLATGHGLVLCHGHAPEEGYSNSLWMLWLAFLRTLGIQCDVGAKVSATIIGSATVAASISTLRILVGRPPSTAAFWLTMCALLSPPWVVWSISGLEHGLQALLMVLMVRCAAAPHPSMWQLGLTAGALVLVRPEAPLVVAPLGLFFLFQRGDRLAPRFARVAPFAAIPLLTLASLLVFRWHYFGDIAPNPYYAKASEATFLRLLNPWCAGFRYVSDWLAMSGWILVIAPWVAISVRGLPRGIAACLLLLAGQLVFVIYANGDWMDCWRFMAAPMVLLGIIAGWACEHLDARDFQAASLGRRFSILVCTVTLTLAVPRFIHFLAAPTTPYPVVAHIGRQFETLARNWGIERASLAHHDAGGTSYRSTLDLIDLGGLGCRAIAKQMGNGSFLHDYIFTARRPHFIFGSARNFAAGTGQFATSPVLLSDYVPVYFEGDAHMKSDLCHARTDIVRKAPGVALAYHQDGRIASVTVAPRSP